MTFVMGILRNSQGRVKFSDWENIPEEALEELTNADRKRIKKKAKKAKAKREAKEQQEADEKALEDALSELFKGLQL